MSFLRSLLVTCMVTASTCRLPFEWCSPPQWEAIQGTLRGVFKDDIPHMEASNLKISYDLNHSRIATTQLQDGDSPEVKKIYDYTQKTLYVIENNACRRVLLNETFRKACIPQDAYFSWDKTRYGLDYNNAVWIQEFRGSEAGISYILQTTYDHMPVFETIYGDRDGEYVFSNSAFVNTTLGIKNPDVFTPPPSCKGANYEPPVPRRLGFMTF
ncbi:mammalian ependymin-related protein 1-like [Haliotis cracherodii]|uniref:mammalian ependymin-related protein 1-like n=1 Tax=Haliotis cracherodii TaxID=6455 RepID=UPI0039EA791B